jgi:menaquinone-dependent protoporphyrinogen oxidase
MRVLVAFGSTRGGTRGLAYMVADGLRDQGMKVDVRPASAVRRLSGYDAVIVGGALYAGRWHQAARQFVLRHRSYLLECPTFFFSSGPLDDSASDGDVPPVKGVEALMQQVAARGHATFGGRLDQNARGFLARALARKHAGDWRDNAQVRRWTAIIAAEMREAVSLGA